MHFPTLQEPGMTSEYAAECAKLFRHFAIDFKTRKVKQGELNIFEHGGKVLTSSTFEIQSLLFPAQRAHSTRCGAQKGNPATMYSKERCDSINNKLHL